MNDPNRFHTDQETTEAILLAMTVSRALGAWVEHSDHVISRHYRNGSPAAVLQGTPGYPYFWWVWGASDGFSQEGGQASREAAQRAADDALTQTATAHLAVLELTCVDILDFGRISREVQKARVAEIARIATAKRVVEERSFARTVGTFDDTGGREGNE